MLRDMQTHILLICHSASKIKRDGLYPDKLHGFVSIDSAPLQRKYITGAELWLLKRMEPVYRHYPWKLLLERGSSGVATSEYGRSLMRSMMMTYTDEPDKVNRIIERFITSVWA